MSQIQKHRGDTPPEQPQIIIYHQPDHHLQPIPKGHWMTTDAGRIFAAAASTLLIMAASIVLATVSISVSTIIHGPQREVIHYGK